MSDNSLNLPGVQGKTIGASPVRVERLLRRLNYFVPMLTVIVGILSFVGGTFYNAYMARQVSAETSLEQWRLALEKVSFDDGNLLPSALLMESFSDSATYRAQARAIEVTALVRFNEPDKFDTAFFDMKKSTKQEDLADLIEVGKNISDQLRGLYTAAIRNGAALRMDGGESFPNFLANPDLFLSRPEDAGNLKRTLALLWELDSVSGGLQCVWKTHATNCPNLTPKDQELIGLILVNHDFSGVDMNAAKHGSSVEYYKTCSVDAVEGVQATQYLGCG